MEKFSALLAFCAGNSTVTGKFHAQRPVTRSFGDSLICARTGSWANYGDAGDLRRYRDHYNGIVMKMVESRDIVVGKCRPCSAQI